ESLPLRRASRVVLNRAKRSHPGLLFLTIPLSIDNAVPDDNAMPDYERGCMSSRIFLSPRPQGAGKSSNAKLNLKPRCHLIKIDPHFPVLKNPQNWVFLRKCPSSISVKQSNPRKAAAIVPPLCVCGEGA